MRVAGLRRKPKHFTRRSTRFMKPTRLRLFIKPGCPWCDDALDWFAARGIAHLGVLKACEELGIAMSG